MEVNLSKCLPPKDGEVYVNPYGCVVMSAKTYLGIAKKKYRDQVITAEEKLKEMQTDCPWK